MSIACPNTNAPPVVAEQPSKTSDVMAENRYRYNSNGSSNLTTYAKANGDVKQAMSFYNTSREMAVVERDFPSGDWGTPVVVQNQLSNTAPLEYDNHNFTAIAAAGGVLTVTGNMHVDPLRMAQTDPAADYDLSSFSPANTGQFVARDIGRVTYPEMDIHAGEVLFSFRHQIVGGGHAKYIHLYYKYHHSSDTWERLSVLGDEDLEDVRLYMSPHQVDLSGRIHAVGEWRDETDAIPNPGTISQHDLFHVWSDDGRDWFQYVPGTGGTVALPSVINWNASTFNSNVPQNFWDTPPDPIPSTQGKVAGGPGGAVYHFGDERAGPVWSHYWDGTSWTHTEDPLNTSSEEPFWIGATPCLISHSGDKVYFHDLTDINNPTTVLLATGYINGTSSISIDKSALRRGYVSFMMTENESNAPRSTTALNPTPMCVATIASADIFDFNQPWTR